MRTTVVIATRNRSRELARTLGELCALQPKPPIIVVDNASIDDTAEVAVAFPGVRLIRLPRNHGAAARTAGVHAAETPYVAFSDDDSWWAKDALPDAERAFDAYPRLGLVAARTLVGPEQREDPVTPRLANSPLGCPEGVPGPLVLGFLACSAVVRRTAYLQAGGFSRLLRFGAEERLLAYDLATAGWDLCYLGGIRAFHHPSPRRPSPAWRRRTELRNRLLIAWLRRPRRACLDELRRVARGGDRVAFGALAGALLRLPRGRRRVLPDQVEARVRMVEGAE